MSGSFLPHTHTSPPPCAHAPVTRSRVFFPIGKSAAAPSGGWEIELERRTSRMSSWEDRGAAKQPTNETHHRLLLLLDVLARPLLLVFAHFLLQSVPKRRKVRTVKRVSSQLDGTAAETLKQTSSPNRHAEPAQVVVQPHRTRSSGRLCSHRLQPTQSCVGVVSRSPHCALSSLVPSLTAGLRLQGAPGDSVESA